MAGWTVSALESKFAARFATKATRFRAAVTAGFALTTVGALTIGGGSTGFADDIFSALGTLFQAQPSYSQYRQPGADQQSYAMQLRYARRATPRLARRRHDEAKPALRLASLDHDTPARVGRVSMCVRLCDGFAFPVGAYHGEADRASHEATCQSECPGARTALYVLPNGSDQIGDAVEARTGRSYSQIPAAFHYTTFVQDSCSCHPQGGNRIASLLHDFTLRRGDAVMTPTGVKVFHGGAHYPYRQADFVTLARSRDVHSGLKATFHAIERASLRTSKPAVAQNRPATPSRDAAAAKPLPAFEKQASLTP